ncbi:MAG: HEPN domain-containing protein [Steroidobacteraceae bacterium]|nr:HEPN domain-containing protein [Deltaproteobacteria bacterium]
MARYRLERAFETLEEAELLFLNGHVNTFVNRLYYACFYAVSAWLLLNNLSSSKHSGIRAMFHQHLVKPGIVKVEQGLLYDRLFNNRQKADYLDLTNFEAEEVASWLDEAREFVESVNALIAKEKYLED